MNHEAKGRRVWEAPSPPLLYIISIYDGGMNMKKVGKTMKRFWPLYLMFMPGVIYLFINCYIPMFGIQIAFRQYNARDGIYGSPWCGFKNFEFLFRTNDASS